jgi:hypothetical protein
MIDFDLKFRKFDYIYQKHLFTDFKVVQLNTVKILTFQKYIIPVE